MTNHVPPQCLASMAGSIKHILNLTDDELVAVARNGAGQGWMNVTLDKPLDATLVYLSVR